MHRICCSSSSIDLTLRRVMHRILVLEVQPDLYPCFSYIKRRLKVKYSKPPPSELLNYKKKNMNVWCISGMGKSLGYAPGVI